ncbi:MAG: hypothetical protein ABI586_07825 [Candidatus Nanopelagicales bacterium]
MSWSWRFETKEGVSASGEHTTADTFPSQSDAESWLGETWRDLLKDGVDQVTLLEDSRVVYGPMSLHPTS